MFEYIKKSFPQVLDRHPGISYYNGGDYDCIIGIRFGYNNKLISKKESFFSDTKTIKAQFTLDERAKFVLEKVAAEAKKDDIDLEYGIEVM